MSQDESRDSGWVEATGKTVAEATRAALDLLGVAEDNAEIEVVEEAQRGILGLGSRGARVRARPKTDKSEALLALVRDIVRVLGLTGVGVTARRDDEGYIRVDVTGPNLGVIIGRRGETLDALQYLLNLAAARLPGKADRVVLDAGGYRERRRRTLESLAERIAERVRRTGEEVALEPMTPQERKVVHMAVSAMVGVRSESRGEDPLRRVVICPAEGGEADEGVRGENGEDGEAGDDDEE